MVVRLGKVPIRLIARRARTSTVVIVGLVTRWARASVLIVELLRMVVKRLLTVERLAAARGMLWNGGWRGSVKSLIAEKFIFSIPDSSGSAFVGFNSCVDLPLGLFLKGKIFL